VGMKRQIGKMIKAYINYPNPHVTIHSNLNCGNIQAQSKPNQRYIKINTSTISRELQNFHDKKYTFAANPAGNDMWLEIDFQDLNAEQNALRDICQIVGYYYKPLRGITPIKHC
jgi:hypothetical protein